MEIPAYLMKPGYLEKQDLKGSWRGMRYRLHMAEAEESGGILEKGRAADDTEAERAGRRLFAWVWPQPLCFEAADGDGMLRSEFPFSREGIDAAGRWLAAQYEEREELWKRSHL